MSKPVRLPDYLAAEIEKLAAEEKRSLANMVQVLLEQALKVEGEPITNRTIQTEPFHAEIQTTTTRRAKRREEDPHFKPDFK